MSGRKTSSSATALHAIAHCQVWPKRKRLRQTSPAPTVMYDS